MANAKMSHRISRLVATVLSIALLMITSSCGLQPVIHAGIDRTVFEGKTVTLTAISGSTATLANFIWEQLEGPLVVITNAGSSQATFTVPAVDEETDMVFQVTAFSALGTVDIPVFGGAFDFSADLNVPTSDTVTITVLPNPTPQADAGADITATGGAG